MPKRLTRSPVEASDGTRPSQAINWRGVSNRPRSPASERIVVAATRSKPRIAITAVTVGANDQSGRASYVLCQRGGRAGSVRRLAGEDFAVMIAQRWG